jgi:hypothetical protein
LFALLLETFHAYQPLTAHKVKMIDQMMPKAASGGFQSGCFKAWYQGPRSVNEAPMDETKILQANAIANPLNRSATLMS